MERKRCHDGEITNEGREIKKDPETEAREEDGRKEGGDLPGYR